MKKKLKYNHIAFLSETDSAVESDAGALVGTLFRKQIAKFGKWVNPLYPIEVMEFDEEWAKEMVKNFEAKVIDRVPVPLDHTDQTEANTGEVMKLEIVPNDGLYAYLDIRRPNVVEDIKNGLIFDVSMSLDFDYVDTKEGKHHGATLLHVALVNNPYLKGMPAFEEALDVAFSRVVSKLQTNLSLPKSDSVIMLSESKHKELSMDTATIKNDRDFPVNIVVKTDDDEVTKTLQPGEEVDVPKDQAEAILTTITDAVKEDEKTEETPEEKAAREAKEAEEEAARKKQEEEDKDLTDEQKQAKKDAAELADLRQKQALSETREQYRTLLSAGKITPAQEEAFMKLSEVRSTTVSLSSGQVSLSELVTEILEAGPTKVNFSEEGKQETEEEKAEREKREAEEKASKNPSESLSEAESKGMEAVGSTPERMDELAKKYPAMKSSLESK